MTPVLRSHILAAAPRRAPGFVAAYLAAAAGVYADRLLMTPEARAQVRRQFPPLSAPREYPPAEAAADAARWPPAAAPPRPAGGTPPAHWGPLRWAELHARPHAYRGDALAELAWLYGWSATLPRSGCRCMAHWAASLSQDPPDLASAAALARWGWRAHNRVNARLGRPLLPYEAACRLHHWPLASDVT